MSTRIKKTARKLIDFLGSLPLRFLDWRRNIVDKKSPYSKH